MKVDDLVAKYIALRTSIAKKNKEAKEFEAKCKEEMKDLELQLLEISNSTGVDSFKTSEGTAFKTTKTYANSADREAVIAYAKEHNDYGLFTNHINKAHVIELIEEGIDPETFGVNYVVEQVIQVRK